MGPSRLAVRVPRALLDPAALAGGAPLPCGDAEGLLAVELSLQGGQLAAIAPLPPAAAGAPLPLALPPLVEPHAHLDKAFSWPGFANGEGSMLGALQANQREAAARSEALVLERGERALQQAWRYGLRAIRSHVDSGGPAAEPSWEALLALQQQWRGRVDLQLVALVPLDHWSSPEGQALARRVAAAGGVLGGVLGPPYPRGRRDPQALHALLQLAAELGCGVDLHVDESGDAPGLGVRLLLDQLDRLRPEVPITCSHASSMGLLALAAQQRLAERLAQWQVAVVALPTTNFWLLGRRPGR
ncbi:MAG: cytosine deaminase, partial [Vulcanococcus sp.]